MDFHFHLNSYTCDADILNSNSLTYKLKELNPQYLEKLYKNNTFNKILITVLLIIYEIIIRIYNTRSINIYRDSIYDKTSTDINSDSRKIDQLENIIPFIMFTDCICSINIILCFLSMKRKFIIKFFEFFTYLIIVMQSIIFREIVKANIHFYSFGINSQIENLFKFFYISMIYGYFYNILLSSIISIAVSWYFTIFSNFPKKEYFISTAIENTFSIIIILYAYRIEKTSKINFYNQWKDTGRINWLRTIIDEFQNGFAIVYNENLMFVNNYLVNKLGFLIKNKRQDDMNKSLFESLLTIKNEKINDKFNNLLGLENHCLDINVFQNLENINPNIENIWKKIKNSSNEINLSEILNCLNSIEITNNNEFVYIGTKSFIDETIPNLDENIYLEISFRIIEKNKNENKYYEFIFNDITRSIHEEKRKAQEKYKNLFLAKISHEFKNPLITIKEILDQITDELPPLIESKNLMLLKKNFKFSKNLCSYLLILVKDLEVVSKEDDINNQIEIFKSNVNIRDEMSFIEEIVTMMISKQNEIKNCVVNFNLLIRDNVDRIIKTDRTRLSQILLNLLSNSIKFTQTGTISLIIEKSNNNIKFIVKDEGIGISENEVPHIFSKFYKKKCVNNYYGGGLGLGIVKDLCYKLGSEINFNHNKPKGCIFSFTIVNDDQMEFINSFIIENSINSESEISTIEISERVSDLRIPIYKTIPIKNKSMVDSFVPSTMIENYLSLSNNPDKNNINKFPFIEKLSSKNVFMQIGDSINMSKPTFKKSNATNFSYISNSCISQNNSKCDRQGTFSLKCVSDLENYNLVKEEFLIKKSRKFYFRDLKLNYEEIDKFEITIIIADDEVLIRKSITRQLDKYFKSLNKNIELTLIEVDDGIECLYAVYTCFLQQIKIDLVLSDETMKYMTGSQFGKIISELFENEFPVYIITAYENNIKELLKTSSCIKGAFTKPVTIDIIKKILPL